MIMHNPPQQDWKCIKASVSGTDARITINTCDVKPNNQFLQVSLFPGVLVHSNGQNLRLQAAIPVIYADVAVLYDCMPWRRIEYVTSGWSCRRTLARHAGSTVSSPNSTRLVPPGSFRIASKLPVRDHTSVRYYLQLDNKASY